MIFSIIEDSYKEQNMFTTIKVVYEVSEPDPNVVIFSSHKIKITIYV
jgi:hypothetical protein